MSPQAAIHVLIDDYSDELFRFVLNSVDNRADAKDIVQDCFVRAFQGWGEFRGSASARTWLYQIARNGITDYHRRRQVRANYAEEFVPELNVNTAEVEELMDVRNALQSLKLEQRQVLILRIIEDLSVRETARILGWSMAKVRVTQHRAIRQLRGILGEGDGAGERKSGKGVRV